MSLTAIAACAQSNTVSSDKWTYNRKNIDGATVDTWTRNTTLQPSGGETMVHITMAHDKVNGGNLLESSMYFCQFQPLPSNQFYLTFTNKAGKEKRVFFEINTAYAKQDYYVYGTLRFADCMDIIKSGTTNFTMEFTNGQTATLTLDFNISKGDTKTATILRDMKASAQKQWEATTFITDDGRLYYLYDKEATLKTGEKFSLQILARRPRKNEAPGFYGSQVNLIFSHPLPSEEFTLKFQCSNNETGLYMVTTYEEDVKMKPQESPFAFFTHDEQNGQYVYQASNMFIGNTLMNLTARDFTMEFPNGKKLTFNAEFSTKKNVRWVFMNYQE